ncbi:MAG: McrC family protein [Succinivibrionaceae bacterium]
MNKKIITLKEFEFITDNEDFENDLDSKVHYLPKEIFKELSDFIKIQNGNSEESEVMDFFKLYSRKGIGDVIQTKNYVGLVQLESGYQIQVLSKIDMVDIQDEWRSTADIFIDMLRSMKDFPCKVFSHTNLRTESMNLYEIFINMYVQQVAELTKRGLKSSYLRDEDNLRVFKGKLIVSEHIKKNVAHDELFYVSFDEYSQNRPENKIIKATLLKLQKISTSSNNLKAIRQQLTFFDMVDPSLNYSKDFSQIVIDRNTSYYEEVISWSKIFLMNKSFSTFSGENKARALLFPMEKVYEAFVAQQMEYVFAESDIDVSVQDSGQYLFKEGYRDVFSLRPDLVVTDSLGHTIIMDTKWKRLCNNPERNYGISQADMYQMYAYSKKYNTSEIWLLYPINDEMRGISDISYNSGDGTNVNVFFVDLSDIERSLSLLKSKIIIKINYQKLQE